MHRRTLAATLLAGCLAAACAAQSSQPAASPPGDVARLVEKIARGDEVQAADAKAELIRRLTAPLVEAIGSLEGRPVEEQVRLQLALFDLAAETRLRLARADLSPDEQKLFDDFVSAYPSLAPRLFHDDPETRLAALRQIPLDPGTGAGLMVAARVFDWDTTVVDAALDIAESLHDDVVARRLARFAEKYNRLIADGFFGTRYQDMELVLTDYIKRACVTIGRAGYKPGADVILESLRIHARGRFRNIFEPGRVAWAYGQVGDRKGADLLLAMLDDGQLIRWASLPDGTRASQSVGDAALAALLKIHGLSPTEFGMLRGAGDSDFLGFVDDDQRREARRKFRAWLEKTETAPPEAP